MKSRNQLAWAIVLFIASMCGLIVVVGEQPKHWNEAPSYSDWLMREGSE